MWKYDVVHSCHPALLKFSLMLKCKIKINFFVNFIKNLYLTLTKININLKLF